MAHAAATLNSWTKRFFRDFRQGLLAIAASMSCGLTADTTHAQQNLFNVPSAEITDAYTMFFGPSGIFMGEAVTHRSRSR